MKLFLRTTLLSLVCVLLRNLPSSDAKTKWTDCKDSLEADILKNKTFIKNYKILTSGTKELCLNGGTCLFAKEKLLRGQSFIEKILRFKTNVVKCLCPAGSTGQFCESPTCTPNPCEDSVPCTIVEEKLLCDCPAHKTGRFCETQLRDPIGTEGLPVKKCKKGKKLIGDVTCLHGKCKKKSKVVQKLHGYMKKDSLKRNTKILLDLAKMTDKIENVNIHNKQWPVCDCEAGYTGLQCNLSCNGTYGEFCRKQCGFCLFKISCHPKTGKCKKCEPGYKMPYCQADPNYECVPKVNCIHGTCSDNNTTCTCDEDWSGQKCQTECPKIALGKKCTDRCGKCKGGICNNKTNVCTLDCSNSTDKRCSADTRAKVLAGGSMSLDLSPPAQLLSLSGKTLAIDEAIAAAKQALIDLGGHIYDDVAPPEEENIYEEIQFPSRTKAARPLGTPPTPPVGVAGASINSFVEDIDKGFLKVLRIGAQKQKEKDSAAAVDGGENDDVSIDLTYETIDFNQVGKRQAGGGGALRADFEIAFPRGSVNEDGLKDSLTTSIREASDEVEIPGAEINRDSIEVRQVNLANTGGNSSLDSATLGGIVGGAVLVMGLSIVVLVVIKKNKRRRELSSDRPGKKPSKVASKKSTTSRSRTSRSTTKRSISKTSKSVHSKRSKSRSVGLPDTVV